MMNSLSVAFVTISLFLCASVSAQTGPWVDGVLKGRIALSHDGNFNDEDDWGAFPVITALLDAYRVTDKVVHIDFNNIIQDNDPRFEKEMTASVLGAAERYGLPVSILHNCRTDLVGAIKSIRDAVNSSSAENPLYYLLVGPMDVPYYGIAAADPARRRFVHCISHNYWNDGFAANRSIRGLTKRDVIGLGVNWIQVQDGGARLAHGNTPGTQSTPEEWALIQWMRDSRDLRLNWVHTRFLAEGRFDACDATVTYFFLTGDEQGDSDKLAAVLDGKQKLAPILIRPAIRLEAENFASLEGCAPAFATTGQDKKQVSHRGLVRIIGPSNALLRTRFDELYAARSGRCDVNIRWRATGNNPVTFALRVNGVAQGASRATPDNANAWTTHMFKDMRLNTGDDIAIAVQVESLQQVEIDCVQLGYQGSK